MLSTIRTVIEVIEKAWKYLLALLIILVLGWAAIAFDVNVGGLINRVLGKKPKRKHRVIRSGKGGVAGEHTNIVRSNNPLRDKGEVRLETGDTVKLPEGVKDKDVKKVTQVSGDVYEIESDHERLTAVFDRDGGSGAASKR